MKNYSLIEHNIISAFSSQPFVFFDNQKWHISVVGKPRPSDNKGECKTDVYILLSSECSERRKELKISVKTKKNHHWQESKITLERAKEIFGHDFERIISSSTSSIENEFKNSRLLFLDRFGNTQKKSLTMGWRLEITNRKRRLSSPLNLSEKEIVDSFYKGVNLPNTKKHSIIDSKIIENSGVANYILFIDLENSKDISYILDNLQSLDVFSPEPLFLTFIANNYRFGSDKIDGNRPLAVYVDYNFNSPRVHPKIVFDQPLSFKGKDLVSSIKNNSNMPIEHYIFDDNFIFKKSP